MPRQCNVLGCSPISFCVVVYLSGFRGAFRFVMVFRMIVTGECRVLRGFRVPMAYLFPTACA